MSINLRKIDIDWLLAILGIILLIILLIIVKNPVYKISAIFPILACLAWIFSRKKGSLNFKLKENNNYLVLLDIIFFLGLTLSILSVYSFDEIYVRPFSYFIFITLMIMSVFFKILLSNNTNRNTIAILSQIIIIGINIDLSQLLLFQGVIGLDPWYHQFITLQSILNGHIITGTSYTNLPIFHLGVAITIILSSLNYKFSAILFCSIPILILNTLFIFLISKKILNYKIGLLAALIMVTSSYFILDSIWIIPSSFAFIFVPIIIYLLFKSSIKVEKTVLIFLMFAVIIMAHSISALAMLIILLIGFISSNFYKYINKKQILKYNLHISLTLFIFFTVFMLSWWAFAANGTIHTFKELFAWGFNIDNFITAPNVILEYSKNLPLISKIVENINYMIFSFLAILGSFFMISKRNWDEKSFTYAFIGLGVFFISYFSLVIGLGILQERWIYFSEILLSIPVAVAIFIILNWLKNYSKTKIILSSIIFLLLTFFMVTNTLANVDGFSLTQNTGVTYGYTNSEMDAAEFFNESYNGKISTDGIYGTSVFQDYLHNIYGINDVDEEIVGKNFTDDNYLKVIRENIINNPSIFSGSVYKVNYDVNRFLDSHYNEIYDSGTVKGYF
ncbi:hypothetical protein [Methanobacterium sp. SMA-27]|uniref:hypothetical protein n=1 Tax=Methanobacterium sp. SMA-27 TaxID=1495336 RepID=UPI00064FA65D|nr:hypothetical protein [Methanobacterium sp. SMA-27]